MKKCIYAFLLCWIGVTLGCIPPSSSFLRIATAANMQIAIDALTAEFTKRTGTACEVIVSSSGKLTAQIMQGAPYDVFLSADMKYPEQLLDARQAIAPILVYAEGSLIIWSQNKLTLPDSLPQIIHQLQQPIIQHIALANPKTAPYGRAALEVLEYYGIADRVQQKLVFGESIAQTNQFIVSRAAEIGFTAKSVLYTPHLSQQGSWREVPRSLYTPIQQGAVLLRTDQPHPGASDFMTFLQSPTARTILRKFGYLTP